MKTLIIGAGSDLGCHIDGAKLGPNQLFNDIKTIYQGESELFVQDEEILKSKSLADRRKNEYEIDKFNSKLYNLILEKQKDNYFTIVIGGDHSVSIPNILASEAVNDNIGIIAFDSHPNFSTFKSTVTGNIHDFTMAAVCGVENRELRYYHEGNTVFPSRCVVIGPRSIPTNEKDDIKYSGATVFTTKDINEKGWEEIINEAFTIAGEKTKGIYVSFDMDIIDPEIAPGVSTPSIDGISEADAMKINELIIGHMADIVAYDLVEFNPLHDINRKTEQIAINLLAQILKSVEKKKEKPNYATTQKDVIN